MAQGRYSSEQIQAFVDDFNRDGFCILPQLFSTETLKHWSQTFTPLLFDHIEREGHMRNRGANRYYVTLPFRAPFAEPAFYENDDVFAICSKLVGEDMVMCQLATDTPLKGSDFQELHRDTPPLFPEAGIETPPFQLAVNFPLTDVTLENGPFEVARGTHMVSKQKAFEMLKSGETKIEPIMLKLGDVMIRDVRGIHRGTPNKTSEPRPMCVIGYSRKWLHRPEVSIHIPKEEWAKLSDRAKQLLRYNPIVDGDQPAPETEVYQAFAY